VRAFTIAYIHALQDLQDPAKADDLFAAATAAGIDVSAETQAEWANRVGQFAPFDGGFGSLDQGGGLGELESYLSASSGTAPDMGDFISWATLSAAQADLGVPLNPDPTAAEVR
jgi:hypothetical protein